MLATCNVCGYQVSWDEIGEVLMTQHQEKHERVSAVPGYDETAADRFEVERGEDYYEE